MTAPSMMLLRYLLPFGSQVSRLERCSKVPLLNDGLPLSMFPVGSKPGPRDRVDIFETLEEAVAALVQPGPKIDGGPGPHHSNIHIT